MKLVVGLGNPGQKYSLTRHNVGFMILDSKLDSKEWKNKFDGMYQMTTIDNEKIIFLKPCTYMNLSGYSVQKVMNYFNISINDVLVIQDDLDLSFGRYRLKKNSSAGGHNGIKSIISSVGDNSFCRLKIGISHDRTIDTSDYVLNNFSKAELKYLEENYSLYWDIILSFIRVGADKTMNLYNH